MASSDQQQHPFLPYTLKIGGKAVAVCDLYDASSHYQILRDDSGEGASTFPEGMVYNGDVWVARISYNGRVWAPKPWAKGDLPLMEPA
ncbi:MAG: hypothetical protein ACREPQ_14250 [Rhodanobacter sp.]